MNVKLTIEYDGTDYHGWQVQPNGRTIQETLESAIEQLLGCKVRLNASGRTDAGVHALAQVANFVCDGEIDLRQLLRGINAITPHDIVVKRIEPAPDDFDPRRSCRSRVYKYRIWNDPQPSVFHRRYSWHVYDVLGLVAMNEAIRFLEGEHDFASFQATGCDAAHSVRRVYRNTLSGQEGILVYTIEATAYLRHMVRNIVGTLVEVGRGDRSAADFAELLRARDRTLAGPTAPPQGLFLAEVKY
jgi:tRNA pseudouridine38-40 synthase